MWIKRKWLRLLLMLPLALLPMLGPVNPKEIEDLLHIMNQTKIEFIIPEEGDDGDGKWPPIEPIPPAAGSGTARAPRSEKTPASNS